MGDVGRDRPLKVAYVFDSHAVVDPPLFSFIGAQPGIDCVLAALLAAGLLIVFPLTFDFGAWYAGYGIFAAAAVLSLTLWGFYQSLKPPTVEDLRGLPL